MAAERIRTFFTPYLGLNEMTSPTTDPIRRLRGAPRYGFAFLCRGSGRGRGSAVAGSGPAVAAAKLIAAVCSRYTEEMFGFREDVVRV